MIIKDAPKQLLYSDPHRYIRSQIMPIERKCGKCHSTMVMEMPSDLRAVRSGMEWRLAYTCLVCGTERVLSPVTKEQEEEEKKKLNQAHTDLTDDEYHARRAAQIADRAEKRRFYLSYGGAGYELASRAWVADYRYGPGDKEKFVEDKFLPEVLPEVRPVADKLIANYNDVLAYYVKQAKSQGGLHAADAVREGANNVNWSNVLKGASVFAATVAIMCAIVVGSPLLLVSGLIFAVIIIAGEM